MFYLWILLSGSFWRLEELCNFMSKFSYLYVGWSRLSHVYTQVCFFKVADIKEGFLFINDWSNWSVLLYLCCLSMMSSCWSELSDNVWSRIDWTWSWIWLHVDWLKILLMLQTIWGFCKLTKYFRITLVNSVSDSEVQVFNILRYVRRLLYRKVRIHVGCLKWNSVYMLAYEWSGLLLILCWCSILSSVLCFGYSDLTVLFELSWCLLLLIYKLWCIKAGGSSVKIYEMWSIDVVEGWSL